jgi:ankyrin repeat protein
LLQTYSSYKNETLLQEFLTACRKTKRFTALCHSWQRQFTSSKERISSKQIEAFDALFARGLMAASRDELVQWNNTWPLDYINITSACLINLLIEHGANPLERDRRGVSLLHWAAGTGNLEGLNQLLPHFVGGVWTQTERDSATPLHWAVAGAGTRSFGTGGHVLIAEFLLSQIGSLDLKCEFVNEVTRDGNSALMWAAWSGSLDCVKLLVSSQADIGVVNRNGCTLAHWATSGMYRSVMILSGCSYMFLNKGFIFFERRKFAGVQVST